MKPSFTDLTPEQQKNFGNGCGQSAQFLNVPDFIFTASCRHHDFNWVRGCGAEHWYENLWKAPYYYTKGNWNMFTHMWSDAYIWWHFGVCVLYLLGTMLFAWPWFTTGRWRTIEEILGYD